MHVLVTGGAGYIGSVTTEHLLEEGHRVTVFDNLERGHRAAVDPRARLLRGDLRDETAIETALRETQPDAVMHFAAYALVGESMEQPDLYFRNNVLGGINLAAAMQKTGVKRVVFSSTCATYGQPEQIPIAEDTPQRPTNPYGESKRMLESVLLWHQTLSGITPVFLRYFNACGATRRYGEDHDPETHLIPNVLKTALGQRPHVEIFGHDYDTPDGTCIRDYIHISDLAQAHILALNPDIAGPFNLGTGHGCSVLEVLETARRVTGRAIPDIRRPRRPGDPPRLIADATKAKRRLGWRPQSSSIQTIVETAWNWQSTHPNGYA